MGSSTRFLAFGVWAVAAAYGALAADAQAADVKVAAPTVTVQRAPEAASPAPMARPAPQATPSGPGAAPGNPNKPPEEHGKPGSDEKKPDGPDKKPGEGDKKPDSSNVPTVQRPSSPPKPGNPDELKLKPDAEGRIRFNFTNQKWLDVLQWLADISKMSLDWQEMPGDYLNLVTSESYTLDQARDLINQHLLARGYTLFRQGEVMSVAKLDKLNPAMVPWIKPEDLDRRDPHEFVKVIFPLDWLLAEDAAEELKPMLSQYGKLSPLKNTNRIEAVDAVVNLREIRRLLTEEQSNTADGNLVAKFELKHTRATEVRELLMQLLGIEDKKKPTGPQPGQPQQPQPQPQPQQGKPGGAPPKKEPEVQLVADERLNTIYVSAPPDKMAIVRQAVAAIDVPKNGDEPPAHSVTRMKVYRLESLDPDALMKTLKNLGGLSVDARFEIDKENKAIIAYASLADQVIIASVVDKLDGGARRSHIIPLTGLRADSTARTVDYMMGGGPEPDDKQDDQSNEDSYNPFFFSPRSSSRNRGPEKKHEDRFRVDADVKGNRLLLWCNEFELAKVEELLENLRVTHQAGDDGQVVQVHRLVTLDPEPLIKTLRDMEALSVGSTLQADKENRAIIAHASPADHAKIRDLITRLDGSGRQFQVVQLRRLEADYVAGTITFMMTGKGEEKKSGYSRNYYFNEYFGRSSRDKQKKEDEFRVDADIEYNRLLLWANDVEMEEVQKLLVKLGEIPAEGGDPSTIRLLDIPPGPERDQLIERLRRAWPSIAPNPLNFPDKKPSDAEQKKPEKPKESDTHPARATTQQQLPGQAPFAASGKPNWFHLAQLQQQEKAAPPNSESPPSTQPAPSPSQPDAANPQASPSPPGESSAAAKTPPPAPITITEGPDGRLIISSQDTKALDRLEMLMGQTGAARKDYDVIHLKYAEAYWVALTLEDFFGENDKKTNSNSQWDPWWGPPPSDEKDDTRRLSRRKPLKFISDDTTNTILVQGATADQLRTIKDLVELYDRPVMTDSESARKTEIFQIRHAKAAVVAEAIKDVYRDLLSANDKALINSKKPQQDNKAVSITYGGGAGGGTDNEVERKPKFKGYLSLGVDEVSNTLVISAPEFLFRDIARLVEQLDAAARPTSDQVFLIPLSHGVNRAELQEKLSRILQAQMAPAGDKGKEQKAASSENHESAKSQPAKD